MPDDPYNDKRRKSRNLRGAWIIGTVLLTALVIFAGYRSFCRFFAGRSRDFMSPFLSAAVTSEDKTASASLMLNSKLDLARKLAALSREKAKLDAENKTAVSLEEENKNLRALLNLPRKVSFTPVFAEVSARSIPAWRERFVINRGEKNGVAPGDLVVAPDENGKMAVVGRIKEVSKHTAIVVTLYSAECRLSVILNSSRLCGGLEFGISSRLPLMKYLPADGTYALGEFVSTSGISAHTPPDLPVGRVVPSPSGRIATMHDQMFAELEIQPLIKIDTVKFVAVYTRHLAK